MFIHPPSTYEGCLRLSISDGSSSGMACPVGVLWGRSVPSCWDLGDSHRNSLWRKSPQGAKVLPPPGNVRSVVETTADSSSPTAGPWHQTDEAFPKTNSPGGEQPGSRLLLPPLLSPLQHPWPNDATLTVSWNNKSNIIWKSHQVSSEIYWINQSLYLLGMYGL